MMVLSAICLAGAALGAAAFAQWRWRHCIPVFLSLANIVFLLAVLPKSVLYAEFGSAVFLSQSAEFTTTEVSAALFAISAFVLGLNLAWLLPWRVPDALNRLARFERITGRFDLESPIRAGRVMFVVLPLFIIAFGGMLYAMAASGDALFRKPEMMEDGVRSSVYYWQKAAQVIKLGVYAYLFKLAARNSGIWPLRARFGIVAALCLTMLVFLVTGQRSGIFLLLLQVLVIFHATGRIALRHLAVGLGLFAAVNILVLALRDTPENTHFALVNLTRRYFFEIEKISGIVRLATKHMADAGLPWVTIWGDGSNGVTIGNLHRYLGHEVLGSISAVPPTVVGEMVLYFGLIFVLPLAIALGWIMRFTEHALTQARGPVLITALATIVATASFLLLNTDSWGFVKRLALELALVATAYGLIRLLPGNARWGQHSPGERATEAD
jgi:hypothetical protein